MDPLWEKGPAKGRLYAPPPPARSPALHHGKSGSPSGRQREGGTGFSFHVGPQPTSTQIAGVFGFKGTCLVPSGEGAREGSEGARERGREEAREGGGAMRQVN